ncbi:hypothetical protein [Nonomuraea rhodomycinica]|uniref:hypothetical protein n=1 Tax=Nonomuraea rhodomycinica TaxID=1712872 RepID=UPI001FEB6A6F|nr:hypothetical protein [Nonomuraea rhodomycinica]
MTRASKRAPADGATAHVLARAGGPLALGAGAAAPPGMLRLTRPDSTGQALPVWPDGVTPALLEEHQVAPVPVERSGETRRVLAACLKCCWTDHSIDPWPGEPAPVELVLATYRALIGRTDDLMRNWAIGALRRLHDSAWVVMADGLVTLGPRCALWPVSSLAQLKELVRRIPEPERQELRVVADSDIVAAARAATAAGADQGASEADGNAAGPETGEGESRSAAAERAEADADAAGPETREDESRSAATERAEAPAAGSRPEGAAAETALGGEPRPSQAEAAGSRAAGAGAGALPALGGRAEAGVPDFDDLLDGYDERRRAELVAAYMVVEYAAEPVQEARFAALRDPALRHTLGEMLARRGRTLIQHRERWISGYSDETAARALRQLRETAGTGLAGGAGIAGEAGGALDRAGEAERPGALDPSREAERPGTHGPSGEAAGPGTHGPSGEAAGPGTHGPSREAAGPGTLDPSREAEGSGLLGRSGGAGDATRPGPKGTGTGARAHAAGTTAPEAGATAVSASTDMSAAGTATAPGSPNTSHAGANASPADATASPADAAAGVVPAAVSTVDALGNGGSLASPGRPRSQRGSAGFGVSNGPSGSTGLGEAERAVLTLVLVHSVAIPRAEGVLPEDTWLSPHPTPVEELRRHTQVPIGELEAALRVLRHAGLLAQVKAGEEAGGYVPGPQFHRLTPAARRRLQEELILAAGPHTPLAAAVRARRSAG